MFQPSDPNIYNRYLTFFFWRPLNIGTRLSRIYDDSNNFHVKIAVVCTLFLDLGMETATNSTILSQFKIDCYMSVSHNAQDIYVGQARNFY